MLSLSLKPGEVLYFDDSPMTIIEVNQYRVLVSYKNSTHNIPINTLYKLDSTTTTLYKRSKGRAASMQFDSPRTILRKTLYDTRNL